MKKIYIVLLALILAIPAYAAQQDRFFVLQDFSKGLNSHISPINTPDNQGIEAQNVRVNKRYGALGKREPLITAWDAGSATINALHRYYKSDGTFKTIIATSTTLEIGDSTGTGTTTIDSGLTDGKRWKFSTFKDNAIGTNGYDRPIKYDGKTTTTANTDGARSADELCADLGAPFAELNTGTDLTAAKWYQYKMQFLSSAVGYYSNARSNPILTGAAVYNISLTDIPIGPTGTTARYVYRNVGSASKAACEANTTFYLMATIADNTTTTANDTMSDATLAGETLWATTSKYGCQPPTGKYCNVNNDRLFIGGNTTYNSRLYFSDDSNPDFFDPDDFERIRPNDGDEITFIETFMGTMIVGKNTSIQKYHTDGSYITDWYVSDPYSFVGCPAPYTACSSPMGIIYLSRDGIYVFDGVRSKLISDAVTPQIKDISRTNIDNCVGIYFNNEYRLSYNSYESGVSINNKVLVYDLIRDAYVVDTINANCWAAFDASTDSGVVYLGSSKSDGLVQGVSYSDPLLNIRFESELDEGTYDDTRAYGTENSPTLEIGWDCTIDTWETELQTKNANIDTLDKIKTYLPDAVIDRPDGDGTWVSEVYQIDAGALLALYWNETLGAYGDVTFQIRLNSSSSMSGITYETAVTNPNGADISGITANDYIQLRANFTTSDEVYSPTVYQTDGYLFRLTYERVGATKETSVTSLYTTGWKDFKVPGYKKQIKRIKIFYTGTSGTVNLNIKTDDGDINRDIPIDLSVEPDFSLDDEYIGDEDLKIFTYYQPINSEESPSLIGQLFRFEITENGVIGWEIQKIEFLYQVEQIYD